jgi:hypothetical protein
MPGTSPDHTPQAALDTAVQTPRRSILADQYNENRVFCHETAMRAGYDNLLFQALVNQIRYLADQPNFLADQRIQTGLSAE